jgi:Restriction endonuclease
MAPSWIFDRDPLSWTDLQEMVGQLFEELGCKVAIGKTVPNVRGAKEIDVYVRDVSITPNAIYLCECKYWARSVPQEIVHSFRTVMADTGAHRGYIISRAGFQSGAFEAAANTNIDLVTFAKLQEIFSDRWRIAMGERFTPYTDIFFPYWDPVGGRMPTFKWTREHVERQQKLIDAYRPMLMLRPFSDKRRYETWFPIILPAINELGEFEGETIINSYRQLYDFIESSLPIALYHFQVLHGEVKPDRTLGEYDPLLPPEHLLP